jgi:hypothetical protein
MPNGDIASGSSDGVVRVFSEHDERWADAEDLKVRLSHCLLTVTFAVLTVDARNTTTWFRAKPCLRKS